MRIPGKAIDAARVAGDSFGLELARHDIEKLLEAAYPIVAAEALRYAADELARMADSTDKSPYTNAGRDIIQQLRIHAIAIEGTQP